MVEAVTVTRPRARATAVLALVLASLLIWTPHARAQEETIAEIVRHPVTRQVIGYITQYGTVVSESDPAFIRLAIHAERVETVLRDSLGRAPTMREVATYLRANAGTARAAGAGVATLSASASSAWQGVATLVGNGVVGVMTSAGVAAGSQVAGASVVGVGIGYGAVKTGIWSWAPCDHWITTGSPDCGDDPVVATLGDASMSTDHIILTHHRLNETAFGGPKWEVDWTLAMDLASTETVDTYMDCAGGPTPNSNSGHAWTGPLSSGDTIRRNVCDANVTTDFATITWRSRFKAADGVITYSDAVITPGGDVVADRTLTTRATCLNPSTGGTAEVSATSDPYAPGDEPLTPAVNCPTGYPIVSKATVTRHVDGKPAEDAVVADYTAPDALTTPDPTDPLSDCRTSGECELMVYKGPIGELNRCDRDDVVCLGWWQQMVEGSDVYTCGWGTNAIEWTGCEPLANIDNPDAPQPGDAELGEPVVPGPGTPELPAHLDDGCGVGFGDLLNPLSGLAKGVGCALEWAFVPTTTSLNTTLIEPLQTTWMGSPPGIITSSASTFFGSIGFDRPGGCTGMILDLTPDSRLGNGYTPGGGFPDLTTGFGTRLGIPCEPPFDWSIPYGVMLATTALAGLLGAYKMVAVTIGAPSEGSSIEFRDTQW